MYVIGVSILNDQLVEIAKAAGTIAQTTPAANVVKIEEDYVNDFRNECRERGLDTYMGDFGRLVVRELTKPNDKEAKNG